MRFLLSCLSLLVSLNLTFTRAATVELLRDRWGIPHVFAETEAGAFFGSGYAAAEDRLLQMELFRRRATGRLAEVYGARYLDSDRKFRVAGIAQHCRDASAYMPDEMRGFLRSYAAGVNAWVKANPEKTAKRMAKLGVAFAPWTDADCICAWMAVAEAFDRLFDESAARMYNEFRQLASEAGEEEALAQRGMIIDDAAAVVPESEMAKDEAVYARLKARPPQPGFWLRSLPDEMLRFSHAWAVDGTRSATGKPLLESDPQTTVSNPPLWYEFHLSGGRFDIRGIGFAGSPAMLIGFNHSIAWGATALGAGSGATFIEKLSGDGKSYLYKGEPVPFERRLETIAVKGSEPVVQEVLRSQHGFVFNSLVREPPADEAWVSWLGQVENKISSVAGLLNMMASYNWSQFREAMEYYYSPGLHIVYADGEGNLGYQTLARIPLTRRTPRMALEGWTGEDEVEGRIPLEEMPNMYNPASHFVSHANNLPVGSWYPYDLGISTGGTGHTARSLRLTQLLDNKRLFTVESFESAVHRDDVQASVASMFPVARRVAMVESDGNVRTLLEALKSWDLRIRADQPTYPAAAALCNTALLAFRRSGLGSRVGGGEGGIAHLARRLAEQYAEENSIPRDDEVRGYLLAWLRAAAQEYIASGRGLSPANGVSRVVHSMPYQANGPLAMPGLDSTLDLVSPPIWCPEVGTIWSQKGNSYTQIVDLGNVDNSRSLLPPGISEDPESPFHADQMEIWVQGGTHPAPLSRDKVEALTVSRQLLEIEEYEEAPAGALVAARAGGRIVAAIPPGKPRLPGRKPDDPALESGLRYLIRPERTREEAAVKTRELRTYIAGRRDLHAQLVSGLRLILHLNYGNEDSKKQMRGLLSEIAGTRPPTTALPRAENPPR